MPIVAAVDQSERANSVIKLARELATVYGVELHVVHVGGPNVSVKTKAEGGAQIEDKGVEEATRVAREIAETAEGQGAFTAVGLVGEPAPELINYSADQNAECIVVSARKRSSLGQTLFGSVSQTLLLNADRPVVAAPHESN